MGRQLLNLATGQTWCSCHCTRISTWYAARAVHALYVVSETLGATEIEEKQNQVAGVRECCDAHRQINVE